MSAIDQVFKHAPAFLAVTRGPDHIFVSANSSFLDLVGRRELVGRPVREAMPEVVAQGFVDLLDRVYATAEPFVASEMPVLLCRAEGAEPEERYASFVYQPLIGEDGRVFGLGASGMDVTEQVLARRALEEREAHYHSLIDNAHDKISVMAADGTVLYQNPAGERLLGWTEDEVRGRSILEIVHPDDRGVALAALGRAMAEPGEPQRLELRLAHRAGHFLTFETVGHARTTAGGLQLVTNSRDITARRAAEAELRESNERFRRVQDASPSGFMVFRSVRDDAGMITDFVAEYANPAAAAMASRPVAEMMGRSVRQDLPAEAAGWLFESYRNVVETGQPFSGEFRFQREGALAWFRVQAVRVGDGFGVSFADVTSENAAAEALREREERFRALVELIPQLVWSARPDGSHDYFNRRWYDYTGMQPAPDHAWSWMNYLHPDDHAHTAARWKHSLATGEPYDVEYRFRRADGEYRWFIGRALPLRDVDGDIVRWFGTGTDVHDERSALQAAEEGQLRYRAVTRATNDVIWDWDLLADTVHWNENACQVLGIRFDAHQVTPLQDWADMLHHEDRERVLAGLYATIGADQDAWSDEYRIVRSDGSLATVLDRGVIVRDTTGMRVRMIGSMMDITQRKRLEEDLRQAHKLEAIGKLAGGVAHDFNNLLTVITSYAEVLLRELPAEQAARGDVDEIRKAANRAATLTRQLLAFSRRQVLQPQVLDLNEIVGEMEKMLCRLIGEAIELRVEPAAGQHRVFADAGQLEQVIMNLAVNARDAMDGSGTLTLATASVHVDEAVARAHSGHAGDYVVLSVSDTGRGMDAATLDRIFDPFFTTKEQGRGTGLGLATVHGIVVQSGGHVTVESHPGTGTTFRVFLPAAPAAPATPFQPAHDGAAAEARTPAPPITPAAPDRQGGGSVLLVEDEDAVRNITRRSLVRYGFDVVAVANGHEALAELDAQRVSFDLVLTDLVMPGMGGRELAARLGQRADAPPVIYMSGYAEEDALPGGSLEPGAVLLEKPFTVDQLVGAVSDAIRSAPES